MSCFVASDHHFVLFYSSEASCLSNWLVKLPCIGILISNIFACGSEPVFLNLFRSLGIDSDLAGRYDNPICRTCPPGFIGRRNLGSIPGLLKCLRIRSPDSSLKSSQLAFISVFLRSDWLIDRSIRFFGMIDWYFFVQDEPAGSLARAGEQAVQADLQIPHQCRAQLVPRPHAQGAQVTHFPSVCWC